MATTELEVRLREIENAHAERLTRLEERVAPLVSLATQIAALTVQLGEFRTELAAYKGRTAGALAVVSILVPIATALIVRLLK